MASQNGVPQLNVSPTSPDPSNWSTDHSNAGNGSPYDTKSPGLANLNYLQEQFNLGQKKVTRDGQPAKRRGPKPDSKPAQTRRQELNRQAQRTHRERKEQYIKALEAEIARMRETWAEEAQAVQARFNENDIIIKQFQNQVMVMKQIFTDRGMNVDAEINHRLQTMQVNQSMSQQAQNFGMPYPSQVSSFLPLQQSAQSTPGKQSSSSGQSPSAARYGHSPPEFMERQAIKQEAISDGPGVVGVFERDPHLGMDFVLRLEKGCRDHNEFVVRRSMASGNDYETAEFSGHALMASVPPPSHIHNTPAKNGGLEPTYPHQAPPVANIDTLNKLLNLAATLKGQGHIVGGQVTPVQALHALREHPDYSSLTRQDVFGMVDMIRNKVRCYGFGAVMEDYELRDVLDAIFANKAGSYGRAYNLNTSSEIDGMFG